MLCGENIRAPEITQKTSAHNELRLGDEIWRCGLNEQTWVLDLEQTVDGKGVYKAKGLILQAGGQLKHQAKQHDSYKKCCREKTKQRAGFFFFHHSNTCLGWLKHVRMLGHGTFAQTSEEDNIYLLHLPAYSWTRELTQVLRGWIANFAPGQLEFDSCTSWSPDHKTRAYPWTQPNVDLKPNKPTKNCPPSNVCVRFKPISLSLQCPFHQNDFSYLH